MRQRNVALLIYGVVPDGSGSTGSNQQNGKQRHTELPPNVRRGRPHSCREPEGLQQGLGVTGVLKRYPIHRLRYIVNLFLLCKTKKGRPNIPQLSNCTLVSACPACEDLFVEGTTSVIRFACLQSLQDRTLDSSGLELFGAIHFL